VKLTPKNYAQTLMEVMRESDPKDRDRILDNFVKVLSENNDIKLMPEIEDEFHKLELSQKGVKQVSVTTARPMGHAEEKNMVKMLNDLIKSDVELKKTVDEGLVGGVIVRIDDKVLDASVKNNLQQLKNNLIK
jgi:F-type H+-transporting ATPase subunit delta